MLYVRWIVMTLELTLCFPTLKLPLHMKNGKQKLSIVMEEELYYVYFNNALNII